MITKSLEEYLKTMYVLKKQNGNIRVTDIANNMNCTKPSVNKAIYNLKNNGLLNYESYGTIELTADGENLAKKILEAYDIVYLFLKDVLYIKSEEAKKEAEKIKQVTNDETINRLAKYVHKVLGLNSLDCNYDINNEKCRCCERRKEKTMDNKLLEIKNLHVNAEEKEILKGINLEIKKGEIHVIMGPNGSGKTTTANAILNNPVYSKTQGSIIFDGKDITELKTDQIARKGIFMSFQLPEEIPGVSVTNFLKYAKNKITGQPVRIFDFKDELKKYMSELNMDPKNMERSLNVGFSGGEKKKNEILQMLVLNPKLAILDETDSGLDVDAIKTVSKGIEMFKNDENAVLIITHNTKILHSLKVDYVHVLVDGKIVKTGNQELAKEIEENGYEKYKTSFSHD